MWKCSRVPGYASPWLFCSFLSTNVFVHVCTFNCIVYVERFNCYARVHVKLFHKGLGILVKKVLFLCIAKEYLSKMFLSIFNSKFILKKCKYI